MLAFRAVFAGVERRFFRLHSATLFASPAVVVDAPAFSGLADHPRRPERGKKKTANDFRGLAVLELFAADLAEDDAVVLAFGPPGGIVVSPGKLRGFRGSDPNGGVRVVGLCGNYGIGARGTGTNDTVAAV